MHHEAENRRDHQWLRVESYVALKFEFSLEVIHVDAPLVFELVLTQYWINFNQIIFYFCVFEKNLFKFSLILSDLYKGV